MEATVSQKRPTMFRLDSALVERLKQMAKKEHRSLNNFIECILINVAYSEPNDLTRQSLADARAHRYEGGPLDPSSVDKLLESSNK
ncbi:MAG: ribbon-helix-helix protein, CopG family [Muribaculaceae bacterium]